MFASAWNAKDTFPDWKGCIQKNDPMWRNNRVDIFLKGAIRWNFTWKSEERWNWSDEEICSWATPIEKLAVHWFTLALMSSEVSSRKSVSWKVNTAWWHIAFPSLFLATMCSYLVVWKWYCNKPKYCSSSFLKVGGWHRPQLWEFLSPVMRNLNMIWSIRRIVVYHFGCE